jgi:Uma2 family endonuclease
MSTATRTITTAEQLLAVASSLGRCELIRGELRMMSPAGGDHGQTTGRLHVLIGHYVLTNRLGEVFAAETGFVLERNPDTVRAPDIAFIARDRVPDARVKGFLAIAPDLLVETLSPDDRASEVSAKIQWWLGHGVREAWVVDADNRSVTVHQRDGTIRRYGPRDTIESPDLLPGFTLSLREIFD